MADELDALRLAEILTARLCHDLSSSIGSLDQALALTAEAMPAENEAFALARQAASDLTQRLRWRRAAWTSDGGPLDLLELRAMVATPRVELDIGGMAPSSVFSAPMGRGLLNVLLLAIESLPRGGRIRLGGSGRDVAVAIDGANAVWPASLARALAGERLGFDDPRSLQAPLTVLLARDLGLRLTMMLGTGPGAPPLRLMET